LSDFTYFIGVNLRIAPDPEDAVVYMLKKSPGAG